MTDATTGKFDHHGATDRTGGRFPVVRAPIAGVLMGLANLVPGVSGGTMVLVMGLYDDFVTSIADVTRFRLRRGNIALLAVLGGTAFMVIALCSGVMSRAVAQNRSMMFSLFIGMTLGGAPILIRLIRPIRMSSVVGCLAGIALMIAIAATRESVPERANTGSHAMVIEPVLIETAYVRDFLAGALGMSAMVLPGISGAYMLLIMGRYGTILAAISAAKHWVTSGGADGDIEAILGVLIPVAVGSILSIVLLSNLLKWLLHHREKQTIGVLLGILFGSVIGIWPFDAGASAPNYAWGGLLAVAGFLATMLLSRIKH